MDSLKDTLQHLYEHNTLSKAEAKTVLKDISAEKYNELQVCSFMSVYNMRSITPEELAGFMEALIDLSEKVDIDPSDKIDMCGTGGDGKNTFNISTLSSVVIAATGIKVTKHGNYGVSSACGSSNVLEALGYTFTKDVDDLKRQLEECNICFLHAPLFHPALKFVGKIRRSLAVKTFFNMLGPLVNPVQPQYQSVGVFSLKLQRLYKHIFENTKKQFSIMYDLGGYDESSLTGITKCITNSGEQLVNPGDFGYHTLRPEDIFGGNTVDEARNIFSNVLTNQAPDAHLDVICANVALALQLYKPNEDLKDLALIARETIVSGKAKDNFDKLLTLSN